MEWNRYNKPTPILLNMSYENFTAASVPFVSWYYDLPLPIRGGYSKATLTKVHFLNNYTGNKLSSIGVKIAELPNNVVRDAYQNDSIPTFVVPNQTWASPVVHAFWENQNKGLESASVHLDERTSGISRISVTLYDGSQVPLTATGAPGGYFCDLSVLFE